MINYYNIMVLLLCSLVFFLSSQPTTSSLQRPFWPHASPSLLLLLKFGLEKKIFPQRLDRKCESYTTFLYVVLRAFRIKKGELKTFFTRVFVKFMWLFYSPKQFWVVNTFYHSMSMSSTALCANLYEKRRAKNSANSKIQIK